VGHRGGHCLVKDDPREKCHGLGELGLGEAVALALYRAARTEGESAVASPHEVADLHAPQGDECRKVMNKVAVKSHDLALEEVR
jgi:hypothetical protein